MIVGLYLVLGNGTEVLATIAEQKQPQARLIGWLYSAATAVADRASTL